MAGGGDIRAELGLGISQFLDAVNRVENKLGAVKIRTESTSFAIGAGIQASAAIFAATIAAGAAAIVGAAAGLKNAFDVGGHLTDVSSQLATSAGNAQVLEQAFENAGLGADSVVSTVSKMQKAIAAAANGDAGSRSMFKQLGLDPDELEKMDPTAAFRKVGEAIAGIQNPTQRSAASMEIFGKSGAKLMSLFGDKGALAFAATQLGSQSDILDRSAADFDVISDTLGGAFKKLQGFFVGMGSRLIDQLKPALEAFNQLDLAGIGEQFGQALADAIDYFRAAWQTLDFASVGTLVGNALMIGLKEAVNFYWASMWGGVRAWGQYVQEYVKTWVTIFEIVTTADFWKGLGNALLGIAHQFNALLYRGIAAVLTEASKIPGFGSLGKAGALVGAVGALEQKEADKSFSAAGNNLSPAFEAITKRAEEAGTNIWEAFKSGFKDSDKLFNTDEERKAVEAVMSRIQQGYAEIRQNAKDAAKAVSNGASGSATGSAPISVPKAGGFAQAVNFLMGRSVNEMILDESTKQTQELKSISDTLKNVEKNTAPKTEKPAVLQNNIAVFN